MINLDMRRYCKGLLHILNCCSQVEEERKKQFKKMRALWGLYVFAKAPKITAESSCPD